MVSAHSAILYDYDHSSIDPARAAIGSISPERAGIFGGLRIPILVWAAYISILKMDAWQLLLFI